MLFRQEEIKSAYIENMKNKLGEFATFLSDKQWFGGDEISFVDFVMYELLDQHRHLSSDAVGEFSQLKAFLDRFEALPSIKSYMESPQFMEGPINNKSAKFGAK